MRAIAILLACTLIGWTSALGPGSPAPGVDGVTGVQEPATTPAPQRAVLVTGASSGIGRTTAEVLAKKGFFVYAGARKETDLKELDAIENVQAIRLDVTVPAEIDAAFKIVEESGRGLYGLINNAGVVVVAPLIEVTQEDFDFQMDVNVAGPYRVTKAFAPLLIESKGRVITTGSISGIMAWGLGGLYAMSKHAVEAYTDALAMELAPFGVKVSVVEPGNYKSKITTSMKERLEARGYTTEGSRYQGQLEGLLRSRLDRGQYKDPDEVAEAFVHALTSEQPKLRYMVVPNQQEAALTIRAAMNKVVQLNQDQPYTYTRDELVEMLDGMLATGR